MSRVDWKKTTQFEGPEESPGFLLWQVSTKWRRAIEAALQPLGLTHPQFVLLASLGWLTRKGEDVAQIELARHAKTDIAMTSQVLRTLEKKGLIERVLGTKDERAKYPRLTKKGSSLVEKSIPLVEAADAEFFQCIKRETSTLVRLFTTLSK